MSTLGDLPPDQARLWMHRVAGWAADYREKIEQQRVTPDVASGEIAAALPARLPEHAEKMAAIFEDFERVLMPGLAHSGHPLSLGDFGSPITAPGILGEWLTAVLHVSASTWQTSPAITELEATVVGWIRSMLGLAESFEGFACDTASIGTLLALAAAREAAAPELRRRGLGGAPPLMIYTSEQAHRAVENAAVLLGLGEDSIRRVETDGELRMRPAALRAAVARDVHARLRPLAVVATVGTTASAAVDPVPAIADVCAEHKLWLHVDAAYGGALAVLPEGRWVLDGVGRADSVVVSPHAWLFVPLDFGVLYTRQPERLRPVVPLVVEPRRFRALKAWTVFRAFGRAGLETRIRESVRLARRFADWVEADPDFELAAPVSLGVVCFRASPPGMSDDEVDALNARIVAHVTGIGRVHLTETPLDGRIALRVAVANVLTTEQHLAEAWTLVHDALGVAR
jgi:aromatic-L-amino-acid/L-tryptophan decarboxylase